MIKIDGKIVTERDYDFGGVPIMAANMDGVATFEMAEALGSLGLFTCLVKTYSIKQLVEFFNTSSVAREHVAYTILPPIFKKLVICTPTF